MKKHLVLIGGGHAHLTTLANIRLLVDKGHRVTVVQPSPYQYYSGMGPGMLSRIYTPEEIRFNTRRMVEQQGGHFILDRATTIDPESGSVALESSKEQVFYDVLSCNVGSYVPRDAIVGNGPNIFTVKPIEQLFTAGQQIVELSRQQSIRVAVIGGGPSSIEVAGNVWRLGHDHCAHRPEIELVAGSRLLGKLPARIGALAKKSLQKRGVRLTEGRRITTIRNKEIHFENGKTRQADIIFSAVGVRPSPIFADSGLPTGPDGGLAVNHFLQSTAFENIFAGGDCISFSPNPLAKVGAYAVRQNPVLLHNLTARLEGKPLEKFDPGGKYSASTPGSPDPTCSHMTQYSYQAGLSEPEALSKFLQLIKKGRFRATTRIFTPGGQYLQIYNLGDNTGIFSKGSLVFGGRLAFTLKDFIDRRFMRTFQQPIKR